MKADIITTEAGIALQIWRVAHSAEHVVLHDCFQVRTRDDRRELLATNTHVLALWRLPYGLEIADGVYQIAGKPRRREETQRSLIVSPVESSWPDCDKAILPAGEEIGRYECGVKFRDGIYNRLQLRGAVSFNPDYLPCAERVYTIYATEARNNWRRGHQYRFEAEDLTILVMGTTFNDREGPQPEVTARR